MFVYTEFMKKKVFEQLTLAAASPARGRHGRQKVSITEWESNGEPLLKRACQVSLRDRYFLAAMTA